VKQEGGGALRKTKWPPQSGESEANREGRIMKNKMPSLLLDEKICFIRLPPGQVHCKKFLAGH